jgi:hypothetical protein
MNVDASLRFEEPVMSQFQEARDEVIPWNPWQQNETRPNHPTAIAMEHQLLTSAGSRKGCQRNPACFISNAVGTLYGTIFSSAERRNQ